MKRRIRLGLLVYGLDRSINGIGRYTLELARALAALPDGPEIFLLAAGGASPLRNDECYHFVTLPGCRRLPGLMTLGNLMIPGLVKRLRLDLVHDPTGVMPLYLVNVPKIVTIHDVLPIIRPETSTMLDRVIYRGWLPLAQCRADAIITDSQQSKVDILRHLKAKSEKVFTIPLAANVCYRRLPEKDITPVLQRHGIESPYILNVGSVEPRKNLAALLRAYAPLIAEFPGCKLVIVGARNLWLSDPLITEMERLKLKPYVRVTGYIPEEDLPAIYNGASLFVFPSLYEGFGLPVLEAMACGAPVITSNVSSLPEVAGEAALLVDPSDEIGITAAMRRVLLNPNLAEDLKVRGLAQATKFSWQSTARQTLAVYQKALDLA